jgi:hypothetical protein
MSFVSVGDKFINLALVAWAEKSGDSVMLHFPISTGHYSMELNGDEAAAVLRALEASAVKGKPAAMGRSASGGALKPIKPR